MAQLAFDAVTKCYSGAVTALDRFTLAVADGELLVLVGPSGAGKTTALRIAAGLEHATSGTVHLDGRPIDDSKPKDRDVAMVFQHSALYPHLTVRDNVAFSLRARRASRVDVEQSVARSARDLGIDALLDRFPGTLSGGQAQRVALARAMVRRPKALLLDEPLASLDAPLRWELRSVLRQAHQREPLTTIYVTHDQEEALALADRLVVLRAGRIEQVGASRQVYEHPANRFVAGFVGSPRMNLLEGTLARRADQLRFEWNNWWLEVAGSISERLFPFIGQQVTLGLRPQDLELAPAMSTVDSPPPLELVVRDVEYCGDRWLIRGATTSGASLVASMDRSVRVLAGDAIRLCAQPDRARFFAPGENGRNLLSR